MNSKVVFLLSPEAALDTNFLRFCPGEIYPTCWMGRKVLLLVCSKKDLELQEIRKIVDENAIVGFML